MKEDLQKSPQYLEWFENQIFTDVDEAQIKQQVKADLTLAKSLSQREYTLWRTWDQINAEFGNADDKTLKNIERVKRKIWKPKSPNDYLELEPELVLVKHEFPIRSVSIWGHQRIEFYANPDPLSNDWTTLRHFAASMEHGGNIGKSLRFLVRDKTTMKYLGILCLSGPFLDLKGLDLAIPWTREQRTDQKRVQFLANGSVIVPTQPFGYNYLGGKLLTLLLCSDVVVKTWEQVYETKLIGIETTALYGKESKLTQYDSLNHWKKYGYTSGSTSVRPRKNTAVLLKDWMRTNYPFDYWILYVAQRPSGHPLQRNSSEKARLFCYGKLGIETKDHHSGHQRKIYFCKLYHNAFEFLREDIDETKLRPHFDNSVARLTGLWRKKYALKGAKKRKRDNSFRTEVEYYDALLSLSWDQTKAQFLS